MHNQQTMPRPVYSEQPNCDTGGSHTACGLMWNCELAIFATCSNCKARAGDSLLSGKKHEPACGLMRPEAMPFPLKV